MVTVKLGTKTEEKPFPKLMKSKYDPYHLFFFTDRRSAISLSGSDMGKYYEEYFDPSAFTDYNEPVTLQNA